MQINNKYMLPQAHYQDHPCSDLTNNFAQFHQPSLGLSQSNIERKISTMHTDLMARSILIPTKYDTSLVTGYFFFGHTLYISKG